MSKSLTVVPTNRFLKDLKRASMRGKHIDKLEGIVNLLQRSRPLPVKNKDHQLTGNWSGYRECHIESDWLLIYQTDEESLFLVRTGTHSDLF